MKGVVVVPTHVERESIVPLIDALQSHFQAMQHDMSILVVDHNSPEGTADAVRAQQARHKNLHLIEKKRAGSGVHQRHALRP